MLKLNYSTVCNNTHSLVASRSLLYTAKEGVLEKSESEQLVSLASAPNSPEKKCSIDVISSKLLLCILNAILLKNIIYKIFAKMDLKINEALNHGIDTLQIKRRQ